jgi:thioredoxin 1
MEERIKMAKEILKFSATWCEPCKALQSTLDEMDLQVSMISYDIDSPVGMEKTTEYKIRSVPTMILLKDGVEINRTFGALSKEKITKFLEKE